MADVRTDKEDDLLKILIVEDDQNVASIVRHLLETEAFVSAIPVDVDSAWDRLGEEPPDAAIVDIGVVHGGAAWDLIRQVRSHPAHADLPIVVLTSDDGDEARADELDCVHLLKPFTAATLLDRVQVALRDAGKAPPLRMVDVVMLSGGYRIEGTVHVPAELERFSDAWDALVRDPREFIPVTDARLILLDDGNVVAKADLLTVRKVDVIAAAPIDAAHFPGSSRRR